MKRRRFLALVSGGVVAGKVAVDSVELPQLYHSASLDDVRVVESEAKRGEEGYVAAATVRNESQWNLRVEVRFDSASAESRVKRGEIPVGETVDLSANWDYAYYPAVDTESISVEIVDVESTEDAV